MIARMMVQTVVFLALIGLLLFGGAGTTHWTEAWVYLAGTFVASALVGTWLNRHDPALLEQRLSLTHRDQERWDRLFMLAIFVVFLLLYLVMGLQRRWTGASMPLVIKILGGALLIASYASVIWTFRTNSFAVPQVRVQKDRVQRVITDGPYALVRHPMYSGALLYFAGLPLLLGAWWGLWLVPLFFAGFAYRIGGEEATLRRDLDGYANYAAKVPYRLVPYLW